MNEPTPNTPMPPDSESPQVLSAKKGWMCFAIFLIGLGSAWLMNELGVMPEVDWIWPVLLAMCGALVLVFGGVDKFTIVAGPFLLLMAVFTVLRMLDRIQPQHMIPTLLIIFGVLIIVAVAAPVPIPNWVQPIDWPGSPAEPRDGEPDGGDDVQR